MVDIHHFYVFLHHLRNNNLADLSVDDDVQGDQSHQKKEVGQEHESDSLGFVRTDDVVVGVHCGIVHVIAQEPQLEKRE